MEAAVLYTKTSKGREEIVSRTHGLPPKLRAILILIDGQRRLRDLRARAGLDVGAALAQLEAEGYIVPADGARAQPAEKRAKADAPAPPETAVQPDTPARPPSAARPQTAARSAEVTSAPAAEVSGGSLRAARDTAVRLLKQAMGRDAGNFAARLASCTTAEDLLSHVERYAIVIAVRDKALGDRYLAEVRAALQELAAA